MCHGMYVVTYALSMPPPQSPVKVTPAKRKQCGLKRKNDYQVHVRSHKHVSLNE
jgi:hypothetical protein